MIASSMLRSPLMATSLCLASCRSKSVAPIVDMNPVGDALRFLAVALVLGIVIRGVFGLWQNH